jgi:hypothetical protein
VSLVVSLPSHLRRLAGLTGSTVSLELATNGPATLGDVVDALERDYPMLGGTIRDHPSPDGTPGKLRPFIRFFALDSDLTQGGLSEVLPAEVSDGREVLRLIGAIAGG